MSNPSNNLTHHPNGISSFGLPIIGAAPQIPVGSNSQYWFVDPANGSDGNAGTCDAPFQTIAKAYAQLRSGYWDGIFIIGYGTAAALSAPLVWSANYTFCIGLCAPTLGQQRARITNGVTTNLFTPLVTVSATQVIFRNIEFFNGGADATGAAVCMLITGQRNYFENCQISGGGTTTSAGNTAMRSLVIDATGTGNGENNFVHCQIGLDTILRSSTSSEIEIKGESPRNVFEGCLIDCNGVAGALFMTIDSNGVDRYLLFNQCLFYNYTGNGGASLTASWSINSTQNGSVLMKGCYVIGATRTASTLIWADPSEGAASASMIGINPS